MPSCLSRCMYLVASSRGTALCRHTQAHTLARSHARTHTTHTHTHMPSPADRRLARRRQRIWLGIQCSSVVAQGRPLLAHFRLLPRPWPRRAAACICGLSEGGANDVASGASEHGRGRSRSRGRGRGRSRGRGTSSSGSSGSSSSSSSNGGTSSSNPSLPRPKLDEED